MTDESAQPDTEDTTVADVQPDAENVDSTEPAEDAETFPASVVRDLRKESAGYRERAKTAETRAEELAARLHSALVASTGRLADPSDLAYDAAHLDDADALTEAIDALTDAKPHLKARRVAGDVGQGNRGGDTAEVDLLGMLRARA